MNYFAQGSYVFANETQARAYIPMPNTRIMFIDKEHGKCWVKWADNMGNAGMQAYKFQKEEDVPNVDLESLIKRIEKLEKGVAENE